MVALVGALCVAEAVGKERPCSRAYCTKAGGCFVAIVCNTSCTLEVPDGLPCKVAKVAGVVACLEVTTVNERALQVSNVVSS